MADGTHVMAVGDGGQILRSSDGGLSFTAVGQVHQSLDAVQLAVAERRSHAVTYAKGHDAIADVLALKSRM